MKGEWEQSGWWKKQENGDERLCDNGRVSVFTNVYKY